MLDSHFHLDFLADPAQRHPYLTESAASGVHVIAQTLTPRAFAHQSAPLLALGYHPWQAGADELDLFIELAPQAKFIGEVGLDFSPRVVEAVPKQRQLQVFSTVLQHAGERPMSIHAVQSAGVVLEMLSGAEATPIFHWFSGSSDELTQLMRLGGYISVNPRMLESKRGRAYVRQVPADRILLETDLPQQAGAQLSAAEHLAVLEKLLAGISAIRDTDMAPIVQKTAEQLFGVAG